MENGNFYQRSKRSAGKFLKKVLIFFLVVFAGLLAFSYWGTYESGLMAGKVLRISEKGLVFKTYEGKLSLETFGALKGVSPIAETFDFSVYKNDTTVINSLQQVSLSGERVSLHFEKKYMKFFWRGETKYFITRVERTE